MTKGDIAKQYFLQGNNCSNAVILAFKEEMNFNEETLKKLGLGFGGGFARQRLICGAVSGMNMVLSYLLSDGEDKLKIYSIIQNACERFKKEVGSIICKDLLEGKVKIDVKPTPEERTNEYYKKRPCADLCKLAGDIVEQILIENNR